jgi:phenylacetate-CoA ligase
MSIFFAPRRIAGKIRNQARLLLKASSTLKAKNVLWQRRLLHDRTSRFLAQSDQWKPETMVAWQLCQLNGLLQYALKNCPGHMRKLTAAGFDGKLERLEDLGMLPFFTKNELRAQGDEFTATNFPSNSLRAITSGGTTGTPTRFMVEAKTYDALFDAWRHTMWRRAGYIPGKRCLDITWAFTDGRPLINSDKKNHVYLSIHDLDDGTLSTWWQRVKAFQPEFIIGFPSTATALAKLLPALGALTEVRALLLASETLTADQRAIIAAAFPHARIFQWYGMSEMAGFASNCEYSDAFHHWPQSGIIEVIDDDGRPIQTAGQSGEIVLTGFINQVTPFIRYRTGDRATLGDYCAKCGRMHKLLTNIEGRVGDFLLGERGRVVPISALNFHGDEFRHVFAHQFIQDEPGRVLLRIVPRLGFNNGDHSAINQLVSGILGSDITFRIEQVEMIPRTPRGKQPLIIQRCSQNS